MDLPDAARAKLAALTTGASEANVLAGEALRSANELAREAAAIEEAAKASRGELSPQAQREVNRLRTEEDARRATYADRQRRATGDRQLAAQIDKWLSLLPGGTALEEVPPPRVVGDPIPQIAEVRALLDATRRELREVAVSAVSRDEVSAAAREFVTKLAAESAPRLSGLDGGAFNVDFGRTGRELETGLGHVTQFGVLAWLFADAITERIEREIERVVPPTAVSSEERAARLRGLNDRVLELERTEEALICAALAEGRDASRRAMADPRAVLGIRIAARVSSARAA